MIFEVKKALSIIIGYAIINIDAGEFETNDDAVIAKLSRCKGVSELQSGEESESRSNAVAAYELEFDETPPSNMRTSTILNKIAKAHNS